MSKLRYRAHALRIDPSPIVHFKKSVKRDNLCCMDPRRMYWYLLKGTHTVYFSSSLYIINQKPMIHRTDFHCITTLVAHSSG